MHIMLMPYKRRKKNLNNFGTYKANSGTNVDTENIIVAKHSQKWWAVFLSDISNNNYLRVLSLTGPIFDTGLL